MHNSSLRLTIIAIIIQTNVDPNSMHFEAWEFQPNHPRITGMTRPNVTTRTYLIDIDTTGLASHNLPLNIPCSNQGDMQYTADDLSRVA